jgi:RimJ/RimL family protein N-acetyltransferase
VIATARLRLRRWRDADAAPWAAMCADAEVMATIGPLQTPDEAAAGMARMDAGIARDGHGFWALERRADGAFLGFCGIKPGPEATPIEGLPEIGWRLARAAWGQGLATEAASACLDWAWANHDWPAVFAITTPGNARSRAVMARLGMTEVVGAAFDHPAVPEGHPLRPHLTFRIPRPETR